MKRRYRLTKSVDFQRVRRIGKSYPHPLIVLITLPNGGEQSRFGVAAGRSLGNAVQRNRAKRHLRAGLQPFLERVLPGWDIVVLARRPIGEASFSQIQTALAELLKRANLLVEEHDRKRNC